MAKISPLRRRMIEDMTVRNLSPTTQRFYLAAVSKLSRHFGRSELLHRSGEPADLEALEQSWFEDDAQIAEIVAGRYGRGRAKLAAYLLQSVIARRRDKWADLFLRTVLWMREAPPEVDLCWRELTLVAEAVAGGRDLSEIGLMRTIAESTIAVLASAG